jgi:urea transport system substrate-binding protein
MPTMSVSIAEPKCGRLARQDGGPLGGVELLPDDQDAGQRQVRRRLQEEIPQDARHGDPMEAGYFGVYLWKAAVEKAKSFEVDKVRALPTASRSTRRAARSRSTARRSTCTRLCASAWRSRTGMFKEVWNSGKPVKPDPYLDGYPVGQGA